MVGVEIDMVIADSLKALELYEKVFELQRVRLPIFQKVKMKSFLPCTEYASICWMKMRNSA
jgi:hypothetical protein